MPKVKDKKGSQQAGVVLHPQRVAAMMVGDNPITVELAKNLLGWTTDAEAAKAVGCSDPLCTDRNGVKVYCLNNLNNRPLVHSNVETLVQEILNKRWQFNGEPVIIGKTGKLLNGQHSLLALILAEQDRTGRRAEDWAKIWDTEVTIEKTIVFGVEETDAVINTMDTCKPRSLMDVIFRSDFFAAEPFGVRKTVSKYLDSAVRLLWHRTGATLDAFAPRRTHAEALDFIDKHRSLIKVIKTLNGENGDGKIAKYLPVGYAAALFYMMAASEDDGSIYRTGDPPSEKQLGLSRWDKAHEFWVLIASGAPEMVGVREAFAAIGVGTLGEKLAILTNAWNEFISGGKITKHTIKPDYITTDAGIVKLKGCPDVGGIDLGNPQEHEGDDTPEPALEPPPEDPKKGGKKK